MRSVAISRVELDHFYPAYWWAGDERVPLATHVAAASFFTSGERVVAAWSFADENWRFWLRHQVLSDTCAPLYEIRNEVAGDYAQGICGFECFGYPAVAATSVGYVLTWVGMDQEGTEQVFFRTFRPDGTKYIDSPVPVDISLPAQSRESPRLAGAVWAPAGSGQRPQFYFLITWDRFHDWQEHPEMKLWKGLAQPVALTRVLSAFELEPGYATHHDGTAVEFFTDCGSDLRAGLVWAVTHVSGDTHIMRRFLALSPTGLGLQGSGEVTSWDEESSESVFFVPTMAWDNPDEPDIVWNEGPEILEALE